MASPSELTLDIKPHHCTSNYSMLVRSFGDHHHHHDYHHTHDDQPHQTYNKLQEFVCRLEEERLKIDAFKRELPLCMQLLTDAMEASRKQLVEAFRGNEGITRGAAGMEEFLPLKQSTCGSSDSEKASSSLSDKANWMMSAQLWSQSTTTTNSDQETKPQHSTKEEEPKNKLIPVLSKQRNEGAFLPFSKESSSNNCLQAAELTLKDEELVEKKKRKKFPPSMPENPKKESSNGTVTSSEGVKTTVQSHRKPRRCWSPALHRRFVNALHMLGGSQVATPKQIRELMKVDGLTNDEVKSHLQKYRLHTRRPSPSPQPPGVAATQVLVLGGIWVPPEYATAAGAANALFSPHHASHAPPHYTLQQEVQIYRTMSSQQMRRSDSIEDGKCGISIIENEMEKTIKGFTDVGQNGEMSDVNANGSEISLKF